MALTFPKCRARDLIYAAFPKARKYRAELNFWQELFTAWGGSLWNRHFEPLFTSVYDLEPVDFCGKKILDIGCGPWVVPEARAAAS